MKQHAEISLPVELVFEVMPAVTVGRAELPAYVDIQDVLLKVIGPSGRPRRISILKSISESQLMLWEDEIEDSLDDDS